MGVNSAHPLENPNAFTNLIEMLSILLIPAALCFTFGRAVKNKKQANPDMDETAIPVDLVTCSGSGLDPHISPAAAEYQVARIAKANDMTEDEVREIIKKCTDGKFLGLFGEETVHVLKVNLMLDGIL